MKQQNLTTDIIKTFKPSKIIYAEFAEGGAMGSAGTARVYYLDDDQLHFYLVDTNNQNSEANLDAYAAIYKLLRKLAASGKLTESYAGYNNYVWKNPRCEFSRDDDACTFIYGKHKITPSNNFVYAKVAARFGKREIETSALEAHFKKMQGRLSVAEAAFYEVYIEACKEIDEKGYFSISIGDYWNAIEYIRFQNNESFNLSDRELLNDCKAIQKYRLRYCKENCGWNKINHFFAEYAQTENPDLFKALQSISKDYLGHGFNEIIRTESDCTNLENGPNNLADVFYYPFLVDFKENTRATIIRKILEMNPFELRSCTESISYFFANFIFHEDVWPYTEILPAAIHVIKSLPFDGDGYTDTPALYWLAGTIIDTVWRYIEESKSNKQKYQSLIYDTYWPHIGSIWPIVNYNMFTFKQEVTARMFNDTLSFVMSLDDITERNEEIKHYFDFLITNDIKHPSDIVSRRVFTLSLKDKSPKEALEAILEHINPSSYDSFLGYPESTEEAKVLLEELFRTDNEARITGVNRLATFEKLLLTPNTMGVGEYILKYLDDHFNDYLNVIISDANSEGIEAEDAVTSLFTAISKGASEENEFPYIKSLAAKIKAYISAQTPAQIDPELLKQGTEMKPIENNYYLNLIDCASKVARKHRRTILFQRSALQKIF